MKEIEMNHSDVAAYLNERYINPETENGKIVRLVDNGKEITNDQYRELGLDPNADSYGVVASDPCGWGYCPYLDVGNKRLTWDENDGWMD